MSCGELKTRKWLKLLCEDCKRLLKDEEFIVEDEAPEGRKPVFLNLNA